LPPLKKNFWSNEAKGEDFHVVVAEAPLGRLFQYLALDNLRVIYSLATKGRRMLSFTLSGEWRMVLSFAPSVHASTHFVMHPVSVRSMVVDSGLSGGTSRGFKSRPLVGVACGTQ
jgi:hypothetical protein